MIRRRVRGLLLWFLNHFMVGNHFWKTKCWMLNASGIKVGKGTRIVGPIELGVCGDLEIGEDCWVGKGLVIYGNAKVTIGRNCDLAPEVCFATGTHEIGTHNRRAGAGYCKPIRIGNGCWLGAQCLIMGGVEIGNGCIVAARGVVTKSFEDDTTLGGVPAKEIRKLQ